MDVAIIMNMDVAIMIQYELDKIVLHEQFEEVIPPRTATTTKISFHIS